VRSSDGKPIEGVPVQVFTKDQRGELDHSPLRQEKTDGNGRYSLSGLPAGGFVVGVNGEKYDDRVAWPPRFYPGTSDRDSGSWLQLERGQKQTGIDLELLAPRTPAVLHIEAVMEDGSPALGAVASIENLEGVQRARSSGTDEHTNVLDVPAYVGETYRAKGFLASVKASDTIESGKPIRMKIKTWTGSSGPIAVTSPDVRVRVVLHEDKK
jgi:hypothetical protein